MFKGIISVYGHHLLSDDAIQHVMTTVVAAVGNSQSFASPQGVLRVVPSEKDTRVIGKGAENIAEATSDIEFTPAAKAGLAFSSVTMVLGIALVGMHVLSKRCRGSDKLSKEHQGEAVSLWGFFPGSGHSSTNCGTLVGDDSDHSASESIYLRDSPDSYETAAKRVLFHLGEPLCQRYADLESRSPLRPFLD
jgi:hypothetical protein